MRGANEVNAENHLKKARRLYQTAMAEFERVIKLFIQKVEEII